MNGGMVGPRKINPGGAYSQAARRMVKSIKFLEFSNHPQKRSP